MIISFFNGIGELLVFAIIGLGWLLSQALHRDKPRGRVVGKVGREEPVARHEGPLVRKPLAPAQEREPFLDELLGEIMPPIKEHAGGKPDAQVGAPVIPGKTTESPFVEFEEAPQPPKPVPKPVSQTDLKPIPQPVQTSPSQSIVELQDDSPYKSLEEHPEERVLSEIGRTSARHIGTLKDTISERHIVTLADRLSQRKPDRQVTKLARIAPAVQLFAEIPPVSEPLEIASTTTSVWRQAVIMAEILGPPRALRRTHRLF